MHTTLFLLDTSVCETQEQASMCKICMMICLTVVAKGKTLFNSDKLYMIYRADVFNSKTPGTDTFNSYTPCHTDITNTYTPYTNVSNTYTPCHPDVSNTYTLCCKKKCMVRYRQCEGWQASPCGESPMCLNPSYVIDNAVEMQWKIYFLCHYYIVSTVYMYIAFNS